MFEHWKACSRLELEMHFKPSLKKLNTQHTLFQKSQQAHPGSKECVGEKNGSISDPVKKRKWVAGTTIIVLLPGYFYGCYNFLTILRLDIFKLPKNLTWWHHILHIGIQLFSHLLFSKKKVGMRVQIRVSPKNRVETITLKILPLAGAFCTPLCTS